MSLHWYKSTSNFTGLSKTVTHFPRIHNHVCGITVVTNRTRNRVKEVIGKDDMYGVVCKTVMSSSMSSGCPLTEGHDTVTCFDITDKLFIINR